MKTIGIIANEQKDADFSYTKKIYQWLVEKKLQPVVMLKQCGGMDCHRTVKNIDEMCSICETIVVLGGDGTILQVARDSAKYDVPIIGINLGTLGYLTDVDKSEGFYALEKLLLGEFKSEKRMMLEVTIDAEKKDSPLIALNDVCILRGSVAKMVSMGLWVNNEYIDRYRADGMIVSTPTGSTAYNLSAGGPIFKPDIELIAITPICPHKISSRSSVISSKDEVNIIIDDCTDDAVLTLDGQVHIPLKAGNKINIKKSQYHTSIIKTNSLGFYDILRLKFSH